MLNLHQVKGGPECFRWREALGRNKCHQTTNRSWFLGKNTRPCNQTWLVVMFQPSLSISLYQNVSYDETLIWPTANRDRSFPTSLCGVFVFGSAFRCLLLLLAASSVHQFISHNSSHTTPLTQPHLLTYSSHTTHLTQRLSHNASHTTHLSSLIQLISHTVHIQLISHHLTQRISHTSHHTQ